MKILCVIDSLGQGGAERQLVELALGFKEKGNDVSFLVYHENPFFNHMLENSFIPIAYIHENNYLKRLIKMRRFIRNGKFDSVISFLESSNFICEIAGFPTRKWKLIVGERSANPNIYKSIKLIIFRFFHVFADFIVANTYSNIDIIKRINPFLSQRKYKVIYNIVDFQKWKPIDSFYPRKEGKLNMVIASSFRYLKNLDGLLEALHLLSEEELSHFSIKWYGDVLDSSMIEGRSKINQYGLNNVISLLPATSKIIQHTQEADIVGLFSFYEGFPNAVCEGMACAKPVVCSAISDIPSFLEGNKYLLFDPKDHISIYASLKYIIGLSNDELIRIGKENYLRAKSSFDKEVIVNEYLKILA